MIWQFEHGYAKPRYWIDEAKGRQRILGKRGVDTGQKLDYQMYRLGFRDIARSTDTRSFISTIIPRCVFAGNKIPIVDVLDDDECSKEKATQLFICAVWNSFTLDYAVETKGLLYAEFLLPLPTPIPRLKQGDLYFDSIVRRAAQLICTAPEFDDLAAEVGLGSHHNGVTDPPQRAKLRAELDGIIAHIYGLTEDEFAYVLSTFPLVDESVKAAALQAWRDVADGKVH